MLSACLPAARIKRSESVGTRPAASAPAVPNGLIMCRLTRTRQAASLRIYRRSGLLRRLEAAGGLEVAEVGEVEGDAGFYLGGEGLLPEELGFEVVGEGFEAGFVVEARGAEVFFG